MTHTEATSTHTFDEYANVLNNQLSQLKYINFMDCTFEYEEHKNIDMYVSNINPLTTLKLDMKHFVINKGCILFIQLKYCDKDEKQPAKYACNVDRVSNTFKVNNFNADRLERYKTSAFETVCTIRASKIDQLVIHHSLLIPQDFTLYEKMDR